MDLSVCTLLQLPSPTKALFSNVSSSINLNFRNKHTKSKTLRFVQDRSGKVRAGQDVISQDRIGQDGSGRVRVTGMQYLNDP